MLTLQDLLAPTSVLLISDEVYEHMVFDSAQHESAARFPGLANTRFKLLPSEGSYFQCVDISQVSDLGEGDFCQWLTVEVGVAAIPLSAFYGNGFDQRVVRFCFAKQDSTLHAALDRLKAL